jgi:hypothetical protein
MPIGKRTKISWIAVPFNKAIRNILMQLGEPSMKGAMAEPLPLEYQGVFGLTMEA